MSVHIIGAPLASLTNFRRYHFSFQGVFMQEQEGKMLRGDTEKMKHKMNEPNGSTMYCQSRHVLNIILPPIYVREVRANKVKYAPNTWY